MKKLRFKVLCAAVFAVLSMPGTVRAGCMDSIIARDVRTSYEQRLERREAAWQKLLPDMYVVQYAGGIGMVSAGVGWHYGRVRQWETHMMLGFLPKRYNRHSYFTFTLRELYVPWRLRANESLSVAPLTVSLAVNSILHGDFWMSEPDRYPHGYYGFSSRMRFHLGLGQRLTVEIPRRKRFLSSYMTVYYELSTCDLYLRQKFLNSAIPFKDIVVLGLGLSFTI